VPCIVWETSLLDANAGIRFRGHTIPDLQRVLPKVRHRAIEAAALLAV
jgi:citrate synthase